VNFCPGGGILQKESVMDIKELAEHARSFFESKTRPNSEEIFWSMTRRHPSWVRDMLFHIHDDGDIFPDDYKYEYVVDFLDLLSDGVDPEEPQLEPDPYTHDLLKWLGSHSVRIGYVDEAAEDFGHSANGGVVGDIMQGQVREKEEVFNLVVEALKDRLEAIEGGVEDEFEGDPKGVKEWRPR